jgi:hypothetical protein
LSATSMYRSPSWSLNFVCNNKRPVLALVAGVGGELILKHGVNTSVQGLRAVNMKLIKHNITG